jgi:hypothetical protein
MPLSKFVQSSADRQEALEALAIDKLPEIQSIALELYNSPQRRNDDIIDWFIADGYQKTLAETGNEDVANAIWTDVAALLELKINDLAAVPANERGDIWTLAASIIVAASKRQAEIESGLVTAIGNDAGEDLKANIKGLSREQLKGATFHIKTELQNRKKNNRGK